MTSIDSWLSFLYQTQFPSSGAVLGPCRELFIITKAYVPLVHPYGYHTMLVFIVVHRYHRWVGQLIASLPPLEACMVSSGLIRVFFSCGLEKRGNMKDAHSNRSQVAGEQW